MTWGRAVRAARLLLTLVVLAGGFWYGYSHRGELLILGQAGVWGFVLVIVGLSAVFVATGLTFFLLVRTTGVKMKVGEWVGLTFISNALNYMVPVRPGIVAKATYLKRSAQMAYSRFSSVLVAKGVLFIGTTATLGLLMLVWLQPRGRSAMVIAAVCAAMVALSLVPLYVPLFRFRRDGRLFRLLNNAVQGFEEIRSNRGMTLLIGLSIMLQHLLSGATCVVAFGALGFEISFPIALALVAFASITNVLAITPNNIGVQELVMAYAYSLGGLDFQEGLLGAALIRAAHMVLTFVVAPIFTYRLMGARKIQLSYLLSDERDLLGRVGVVNRGGDEP